MWTLTDAELSAAIARADPLPGVPLPTLRPDARAAAPEPAAPAIAILAQPERALSLTLNARDALGFHPGLVAARGGKVATLVHSRHGWRVALHADAAAAIGSLATELGLDGAHAAAKRLVLDLAGFAALVAAADVLQEAELRAQLDRLRLPPAQLTPRALETSLAHGLASGDPRFAVCAARWSAPVSLAPARGKMKEGLKRLEGAGLDVARTLTQLHAGAGVTALAWAEGKARTSAHAMTLAGASARWWLDWEGVPVAPQVTITSPTPSEAKAKLVSWLA